MGIKFWHLQFEENELYCAIQTFDLTRYYSSNPAVDKLSFQVKAGTVFGLLGPNGAGKSTTIKMLTTLLPVSSGTASILGYDLVRKLPHFTIIQTREL